MKFGRLILGAFVILLAVWIIAGEQLSGASANAFVNARLSTLRTPVAGVLAMPERTLGARVTRGESLGQVTDRLVDSQRLHDLLLDEGLVEAELARLQAQQVATAEAIAALEDRAARQARARIAELDLRLDHARARLEILQAAAQDEEPAASARLAREEARERVGVLELALDAARSGGDPGEDAPETGPRHLALQADLAQTEAALAAAEARLAAQRLRVGRERLRVNRSGGAVLHATVDGQVWSVLAAEGETVERGQPVLRLLDCQSLIVTLSVTEAIFNRLRPGDSAVFRFSGDSRRLDGSVIRLAGAGASAVYENLAVAPGPPHLERYDVALLVPGLRSDPTLDCPVGRTGRVFFDSRPLDWLRSLRFW